MALPKLESDLKMSADNWNKIKEIFLEAMELAPTARARFLEEKCGER
jgi:hypothetical protein